MTLNQIISTFIFKKKAHLIGLAKLSKFRVFNLKPLTSLSLIVFTSIIFFTFSNIVTKQSNKNNENLKSITKSEEFSNFTNFLLSKINSPYEEISYVIKNNDTIEKILKGYDVKDKEIKMISLNLKTI